MNRHRILLQTDPTIVSTGLSENAKTLLRYLHKTGKYDLAHYWQQGTSTIHPELGYLPWKGYGSIPPDPALIQQINSDPQRARDASYGSFNIDAAVKDFKPTIWIGSNDGWAYPKHAYMDKPWYKAINSVPHITIDSRPTLDMFLEQAVASKYYLAWTKFGANEMKRRGPQYAHVDFIYGAMDTTKFSPISDKEAMDLRQRFGINPTTVVFLMLGRNQLRKSYPNVLDGLARFKRENPQADVKVLFHTAFHEQGQGWNIPKLAAEYGVNMADVLATYSCKKCGQWHVRPFVGEDIDCPACGEKKSCITTTIVNRVPDDEMKYLYGLANAGITAMSSGGLEYNSVQTLLCGKPLACTNYSCGEDFCEQDFVFKLGYSEYHEAGNSFIKAATNPEDIKRFMTKVWRTSTRDMQAWGEKGREWAVKTFSIETIGAQWERLFDSMPFPSWDSIRLTPEPKNETFPFPEIEDEDTFIDTLYREILKMNEPKSGSGFANWKTQLKGGMSRQDVFLYFIGVAQQENARNQVKPFDLWDLIDKTTGKARALFVIKESGGDALICTQLFESFHREYPNHDLYIAVDPKFADVFVGNPHVFRVLQYQPMMESELAMTGAGAKDAYFNVFLHPAIPTQRHLGYLSSSTAALTPYLDLP
jgi:glycosyltransferase involved in cell wall biosynthesis